MSILFINACVREQASRTLRLANEYLEGKTGIVALDLYELGLRPLGVEDVERRDVLFEKQHFSDPMYDLAHQFASADRIVIAAPYWDLSFPSVLKIYFENISCCGVTFKYGEDSWLEGLCKADKLVYVTTSGGIIDDKNFGFEYVEGLCNMFGIKKYDFLSAEGLDIEGCDIEAVMQEAIERAHGLD